MSGTGNKPPTDARPACEAEREGGWMRELLFVMGWARGFKLDIG